MKKVLKRKKYIQDTFKILMQEPYQGAGSGIGHVHADYPFSERTTWEKEIQEYPLRTRTPQRIYVAVFRLGESE
ncbi:MAG: hypothetical protein LUH15_18195 [Tannerellaceae bacterium]|nr:hypothetical protein [Tannerellaceae bacterium]